MYIYINQILALNGWYAIKPNQTKSYFIWCQILFIYIGFGTK